MSLEALRAEFGAAKQAFESLAAKFTVPPTADATLESVPSSVTLAVAHKGIVAAHDAISALADRATDPTVLQRYIQIMRALTAELTAVVNAELAGTEKKYEKLTQSFKDAASDLKRALNKAKQEAQALNLAASVVSTFTKLIPVL